MLQSWEIARQRRPTFASIKAALAGMVGAAPPSSAGQGAWAVSRTSPSRSRASTSTSTRAVPASMVLNPLARASNMALATDSDEDEETHI